MEYYNTISPAYNELHSAEQLEKAAIIKKHLFQKGPACRASSFPRAFAAAKGLLLDIGAGTGISTRAFEEHAECIALDPAIGMLKQYGGLKVVARAEQLPFKSGSFGCIVSITALHHADLETANAEIGRVAKKNAKIAVSFFKRAKNFEEAKRLFSEWKQVDSEKDLIFAKQ